MAKIQKNKLILTHLFLLLRSLLCKAARIIQVISRFKEN